MSRTDLLGGLVRALERAGVPPGTQMPRECLDDLIMVCCGVGPDSIKNYLAQGRAHGAWQTNPKHGRGGRGTVTWLGPRHDGFIPFSNAVG